AAGPNRSARNGAASATPTSGWNDAIVSVYRHCASDQASGVCPGWSPGTRRAYARQHAPKKAWKVNVDASRAADDGVGQAKPLVLMIEDDADVAYVVRLLLEDEGYRVEWQEDGRAGLAAAEALRPAVIVLDLRLPGFPGPQVLRALKASPQTRRTPVVVLSAVADRLDPALRPM